MSCVCLVGVSMSEVYMLNSVDKRTLPCGTTVLNWYCEDVVS